MDAGHGGMPVIRMAILQGMVSSPRPHAAGLVIEVIPARPVCITAESIWRGRCLS
jgi:hypothetical protein